MKNKKIRLNISAKIILIGAGLSFLLMLVSLFIGYLIYSQNTRDGFVTSINNSLGQIDEQYNTPEAQADIIMLKDYLIDDEVSGYLQNPDGISENMSAEEKFEYLQNRYGLLFPTEGGLGMSQAKLFQQNAYRTVSSILNSLLTIQGIKNVFVAYRDEARGRLVYIVDTNYKLDKKFDATTKLPGTYYTLKAGDEKVELKGAKYEAIKLSGTDNLHFDVIDNSYDEDGKLVRSDYVCTIYVSYDEKSLNDMMTSFLATELIALSIATVVLIVLYAVLVYFVIIKNVTKLSNTTKSFTKKALDGEKLEVIDPEVKAEDELGDLSKSFVTLEQEIINYTDKLENDAKERERMNAELSIASRIQEESLPAHRLETDKVQLVASMTPAKEVGGDFYDYFFLDDEHIVLAIADVTGKGVPAALFMMKAKGLIKTKMQVLNDLKRAVQEANDELIENNMTNMFVTVFVGVVNVKTGDMECVSAGHERPYVLSKDGVERMEINANFVLGGLKGFDFKVEKVNLKNKRLFLFTDGLNESINDDSEEFGYERIEESLLASKDMPQDEMLAAVKRDLSSFVGKREAFDDVTLLSFEIKDQEGFSLHLTDPNFDAIEELTTAFNAHFTHIDTQKLQELDIIFDELLNNLISYEKTDDFVVDVEAREENGNIVLVIASNGAEFNPLASDDKYISSGDDLSGVSIGGFGITIVKNLCDSVSYERKDGKNVLTLEKSITAKQ